MKDAPDPPVWQLLGTQLLQTIPEASQLHRRCFGLPSAIRSMTFEATRVYVRDGGAVRDRRKKLRVSPADERFLAKSGLHERGGA